MGEVLCSTENSPFLIIDHIHAKINRVCCAALAIGKRCMNVRKNKLYVFEHPFSADESFVVYIHLSRHTSIITKTCLCNMQRF